MLNIGVLGAGQQGIGLIHAVEKVLNKSYKIKSIFEPSQFWQKRIYKDYGLNCVSSEKQVIEDKDIDIIYLGGPGEVHGRQTIEAFKHKKHIYAEKPLCQNLSEAKEILSLLNKNKKLRVLINQNERIYMHFNCIQHLIKNNRFGDISFIQYGYIHDMRYILRQDSPFKKKWTEKRVKSFDILAEASCHPIDMLMFLMDKKIKSVFVNVGKGCNNFLIYPDCFSVELTFEDCSTIGMSLTNIGYAGPADKNFRLLGSKGSVTEYGIYLEDMNPDMKYLIYPNGKGKPSDKFKYYNIEGDKKQFLKEWQGDTIYKYKKEDPSHVRDQVDFLLHFKKVIEENIPSYISAESNLKMLCVIEAIKQSMKQNSVVNVNSYYKKIGV